MPSPDTRPQFLDDSETSALRAVQAHIRYVDAFERQLKELFFIDNPAFIGKEKASAYAGAEFAAYVAAKGNSYTHVYYPWNHHLVKTVSADDYFRLKTNRNQDLITASEQRILRGYRVAVFGLSVGSNVAFTLTQAGISNSIVIADFDELDTTNLNRILAGVHQVGLNKSIVAARRIYEDNPFAEVESHEEGMSPGSLKSLLKKKKIDCIIDEVDDMPFKVEARKLALQYRIPVIMITDNGDGVVLHVERYDLGYDKIFGKPIPDFDALLQQPMAKEAAGKIIMEYIVGGIDHVDPAMIASVKRVLARELVSWSQLGSAALLGGVVATYMIKQIALKRNVEPDIRAYISPTRSQWERHQSDI
ncbi:MAG TPA: ThiF family adenylyltransferase [Candidatus Paceibacterota bacterium]